MRKYLILFICLNCWCISLLQGQSTASANEPLLLLQPTDYTFASSPILNAPLLSVDYSTPATAPRYLSPLMLSQPALSQQQPSCYAMADLAFFCRLEVKLERATKMPVRFRLGDVQQVDYLEGKFTAWRYGY